MRIIPFILLKKFKKDVVSFKLFFLLCLIGTSSLIAWGISGTDIGFYKKVSVTSTFTLISVLASAVIFTPLAGILYGSNVFTESGRELLLSCISRDSYLLTRWMSAFLLLSTGVILSILIPLSISYMRFHSFEFSSNFLLAIMCFILFSFLFTSLATCFSVITNSTMSSIILSTVCTTMGFGAGLAGYAFHNKILYYFSPHALLIRGTLPEHGQITIQLVSIAVLSIYSALFLWLAIYYGKRRDI